MAKTCIIHTVDALTQKLQKKEGFAAMSLQLAYEYALTESQAILEVDQLIDQL